jgi:putative flavoprotein involved in K+ transport
MTSLRRSVDTVVIGAGQSGLVMSRLLADAGREHVLLDRRATLGGGWQDRWDAFQLVTPNWLTSMPGFDYRGDDPDGYMPRDAVVSHFRAYAEAIHAPVELETDVTRLARVEGAGAHRFTLTTSRGPIDAREVIVAGGPFQVPHIPNVGGLDRSIKQAHSHHYRNPDLLPPGGVLLIGSGQTGVQLAEELVAAGRSVTIAVGKCGRIPRRYRGRDIFGWLRDLALHGAEVGTPLPTPDTLPGPAARFACNPQLSGHGTPHDTNLRKMAAGGVRLVGRLEALEGTRARFAGDLPGTLQFVDRFFDERFRPDIDTFIERSGVDAPPGDFEQFAFEPPVVPELDLARERIRTVLWTSGYRPSFGWIDLPVLDEFGLPRQVNGRTDVEGLTFIGTPWLVDLASANLVGVARDAAAIAAGWEH